MRVLYRNESSQEWKQFGRYAEILMSKLWQAVCRTAEEASDKGRDEGDNKETAAREAVTGRDSRRYWGFRKVVARLCEQAVRTNTS